MGVVPVLMILVLLLGGCFQEEERSSATSPIRIGALYPLTEPDPVTGEDLKAGLDLAVEIVNHEHHLPLPLAQDLGLPGQEGRRIELIFRDTRNDPVVASRGMEELVSMELVVAVIGCYTSSVTALAAEQAEILRIPFLNAESTSPVLTQRGLRWFFRTTPDDRVFSRNFFELLDEMRRKGLLSPSCPLTLVYEDGLWGTGVAQAQQWLASQYGYRIAAEVPYSAGASSFDKQIEAVRRSMPAVLLQTSYARDTMAFMAGYRSTGARPIAVLGMNAGFVSPEFIPTLGQQAENVLSREVWALDLAEKKPLVGVVNDLFRQRYGRDMTGNSARSFTGLLVLAEALNRAQGLQPEAVRKALIETNLKADQLIMPWDGIRFDPLTGQNTMGKGIIVQVRHGHYVTVWPDALAVQAPIWPVLECVQEKP